MSGAGGALTRLLDPSATAAIVLGAHDWTDAGLGRAPSFLRSARHVVKYLYDPAGLGLDPGSCSIYSTTLAALASSWPGFGTCSISSCGSGEMTAGQSPTCSSITSAMGTRTIRAIFRCWCVGVAEVGVGNGHQGA